MIDHDNTHDADLEAPPRLVTDLRSVYRGPVEVSAEVDQKVKRAAWRHFAARRRARVAQSLLPLAAAAAVTLAILPFSRRSLRGDLDDNGVVDILDAFALARRMEAAEVLTVQWDTNGDGRVDQADVDFTAAAAVSLR